ncbi:hypothetical protein VMF7928_02864 [Vibrio marisflavi CECT 7928]|uniref:Transposase n=1 Tax=Vibrio marisflavi CECT 7928 TaxID=634439 RepID=A0ABM9A692_9VIBR|nr:hypothetical protein VMF7928_02864 [Vibrio marisflavi CECT 7928]
MEYKNREILITFYMVHFKMNREQAIVLLEL